jgi:hypothetical protein
MEGSPRRVRVSRVSQFHPRSAYGLFDFRCLAGSQGHTDGDFGQMDSPSGVRMFGEFFRRGAGELRAKMPDERMPPRFQESHNTVAD